MAFYADDMIDKKLINLPDGKGDWDDSRESELIKPSSWNISRAVWTAYLLVKTNYKWNKINVLIKI